jgi:hypothetical protein
MLDQKEHVAALAALAFGQKFELQAVCLAVVHAAEIEQIRKLGRLTTFSG